MSFLPKDSAVQQQSMQICSLALPLAITANATPASVVVTTDQPSLLFIKTEGTNRITLAAGAVTTQAELDAVTFATATDSTGVFNALVRINQTLVKVIKVTLYSRTSAAVIKNATLTSAPASGITSAGDKIVVNVASGVNLSTTDFDGCLVVDYSPLN